MELASKAAKSLEKSVFIAATSTQRACLGETTEHFDVRQILDGPRTYLCL